MTDPIHIKASSTRAGLTPNAIFRLWRAAVKDDERLLDEAIAAVHDQMMSFGSGTRRARDKLDYSTPSPCQMRV